MLNAQGAEPAARERRFTGEGDVRKDAAVGGEILRFVQAHGAKPVVATDRIIGCPHEEGDPGGKAGPHCPFWAHRDRWTGDRVQWNDQTIARAPEKSGQVAVPLLHLIGAWRDEQDGPDVAGGPHSLRCGLEAPTDDCARLTLRARSAD